MKVVKLIWNRTIPSETQIGWTLNKPKNLTKKRHTSKFNYRPQWTTVGLLEENHKVYSTQTSGVYESQK